MTSGEEQAVGTPLVTVEQGEASSATAQQSKATPKQSQSWPGFCEIDDSDTDDDELAASEGDASEYDSLHSSRSDARLALRLP